MVRACRSLLVRKLGDKRLPFGSWPRAKRIMMTTGLLRRFVVTAALLAWVPAAFATPITYMESTTATGTVGTKSFTNAAVTVTLSGQTSGVFANGPFLFNPGAATVNIAGLGTYNLTGSIEAFSSYNTVFRGSSIFGIGQLDPGGTGITGILTQFDTALYGYDLKTAV